MKKKEWVNGNKMKFESEHRTFNAEVDCISTGNVIGNVQVSSYFRAYDDLECNGRINLPGHLQNFDLNNMLQHLPGYVKSYIRENHRKTGGIAYLFFYHKNGKRVYIGYVITDKKHKLRREWCAQYTVKSQSALGEAIKYITE